MVSENSKPNKHFLGLADASYLPLLFGAIITVAIVSVVYGQTQVILQERLRERITSIVSTAALQFSDEVQIIIDEQEELAGILEPLLNDAMTGFNEESYISTLKQKDLLDHPLAEVTQKMKAIRDNNANLQYIYILDLTEKEGIAKFVTDSDTLIPIDWDESGAIEEIEYPPLPGEEYDISEIPAVIDAWTKPTAMPELYTDKWGTFLSGYAPIKNINGDTIAVLGVDVQVDDFTRLVRATLVPFLLLAISLLLMLTIQTIALVKIWKNRVETVKELDRQKDELLSIVSHQLATPVSSMKWYMEMLLDGDLGKLTKEQMKHIETVQGITANLTDLVSMILDVSRIQLGRMQVDRAPLDIGKFFTEILQVIEPKAKEKGVEFKKTLPEKLPTAPLDKRLMRMTLENLLTNAVKYTEKGKQVELHVRVENNVLKYEVKDQGCGIPKADQDKIFDKLYRASNVRNVDGNGFGLYAARGAAEAQGGKVWFNSTEGKGTTFFVEIPFSE